MAGIPRNDNRVSCFWFTMLYALGGMQHTP